MSQFLTARGAFLDETGDFEALLPQGEFLAEETGADAFDFIGSAGAAPAINSVATLTLDGDVDYSLASPSFQLNQIGITLIAGTIEPFAIIESGAPVLDVITAQYLTPFGGILEKLEGDAQQLLLPHRGAFADSLLTIEFVTEPHLVYMTPVGTVLTWSYDQVHQYVHPLEVIVDSGTVTEVYERRTVQYLTPFGSISEKTDGANFQYLQTSDGLADDNFELAQLATAYELIAPVIAFQWQIIISGDVVQDTPGPGFEVEGPLLIRPMLGVLGVSGQINTVSQPWDLEGPPLEIRPMTGTLSIIGDIQAGVPANIAWNFNQVGAFTVPGVLTLSGGLEYTLRPDEPFDLAWIPGFGSPIVAIQGALKVLGQIQSLRSFELLTQPVLITGELLVVGDALDYPFPSIIDVLQLGEIQLFGALTFSDTKFRFDSYTEGLPKGWYVDGPILETVPNPNYGTAYGNAFFRRWTWKGYDPAGTMVAASGSEQDCISQTLSVCQSRHQEDWHNLAR